jgi:hypothetical protein
MERERERESQEISAATSPASCHHRLTRARYHIALK